MIEDEWQLFASASAAAGVRSTLSFPLSLRGDVIGGVNLYASTQDAFIGHESQLAAVFGTWAAEGVTNADMDFVSRDRAERGPEVMAEQSEIDMALGVLMGSRRCDAEEARSLLHGAAERAGTDQLSVARAILSALRNRRSAR
jgi:ANTAR domain-containing protein